MNTSSNNTSAFIRMACARGAEFEESVADTTTVCGTIMVADKTMPAYVDIVFDDPIKNTVLIKCEASHHESITWPQEYFETRVVAMTDPHDGTDYSVVHVYARGSFDDMLKAFDLLLGC
jgi:hypothetical protein